MFADERTLQALDFAGVRERVVAATRTERGRKKAGALEPQDDFEKVRREQRLTSDVRELVAGADLKVAPAIDTAELTQAAALGRTLAAGELRAIGDALAAAAAARSATRAGASVRSPAISEITAQYTRLHELMRSLVDAIDERGNVQDRASPALGRVRRSLSAAQAEARDRVAAIVRSGKHAKAIQDAVVTVREGRFVVPVKAEFAGEFPGIVHDTSSSGQTLFIEPLAALETNNRLRTLRLEEEREVQQVLEMLSRDIGAHADRIEANVEMLAVIDLLVAKASVAIAMDATAPELVDDTLVRIESGRHPLLGGRAVPQSLTLDDRTSLLVISGPNMGGKTVALKMVGLFVLMVYAGLQVPAKAESAIGHFTHVAADIGDEQSIVENASTFSAHLHRMREIMFNADSRSLVLIDEIGGGTEPSAGAALAVAFLERLLAARARAIVTTHATELKLFAHGTSGVANASVRFDPQTFAPTFHLDVGAPGQSLAFALARSMGIDSALLSRAQALLDTRERDYEAALAELSLRNAELHDERDKLTGERRTLADREADLARRVSNAEREQRTFADRAETRMQQALRDFVAELRQREGGKRVRVTSSQSALLSRTLEAMRRELGIDAESTSATGDRAPGSGDRVYIRSLRQDGVVAENYGETMLVAIGPMKTVVAREDVALRERAVQAYQDASRAGAARLQAAKRASIELDVRGKRYVEAEPLVERWLDESLLAGTGELRLIHGKGTGLLGSGLQEYLRGHPSVASVRYGNEDEGGGGVSVIVLRDQA